MMYLDAKKTGRMRHRIHIEKRWFRKPKIMLVLQEELSVLVPEYSPMSIDCNTCLIWRDVTEIESSTYAKKTP